MCHDCGCQEANKNYFEKIPHGSTVPQHRHDHHHHHEHQDHHHENIQMHPIKNIHLEQNVLKKNNDIAHLNHHWFHDHKVLAINMMSSPGSGKTSLLERTVKDLGSVVNMVTLVGDQQTDHDALRIKKQGGLVKQITTQSSCHLNAQMIADELGSFVKEDTELLFIENVGNLVCPSAFDLGEQKRVALLSVVEGEDKPVKYPVLFNRADLILITKTDLQPYIDWDESLCFKYIKKVNPHCKIIRISTRTGEGIEEWYQFLKSSLCV